MDTEKNEAAPFELHSGRIQNRIKDVFGCLDELELKHKDFERTRAEEDADADRQLIHQSPSSEDMETVNSQFKHPGSFSGRDYHSRSGRHSHQRIGHNHNTEFKKPSPPSQGGSRRQQFRGRSGRGRRAPDYRVNPEKWTEYSLEDVDVSDSANKKAAFSFLNERKSLREGEGKEDSVDLSTNACSKGQFLFKRPSKTKTAESNQSLGGGEKTPNAVVDMDAEFSDESKSDNVEMEDDDAGNRTENNVDNTSQKRKLDEMDESETSQETQDSNKPIGFKSRKSSKRQIRSRRDNEDDSD